MSKQIGIERTKIFVRVDYLSAWQSSKYKLPGEQVCSTVPYRGYFRKLFAEQHKKFVHMEVSVPEKLKEEDREGFAKKIAEASGFSILPYNASYFEKGDSHSLHFFFCEYIYYRDDVEIVKKTVYIDEKGHYCPSDKPGAKPLQIKGKTKVSARHEIFKAYRAAFVAQMKQLKEKIGEIAEEFGCCYEKGVFVNKFRYKDLTYNLIRKAHVFNNVLKQCDIWLNDLAEVSEGFPDGQGRETLFISLCEKINRIVRTRTWRISEKRSIDLFDRHETGDSFLQRCGFLVGGLRDALLTYA